MAGSQGGNNPSKGMEEDKSSDKIAKVIFGSFLLFGGIGLIFWGIDIIATSPLMDISNAIIGGMAMLLSGFVCLVFLVIFLLSMQEKEGKVREKRFSLKKKKEGKKMDKSSEEVELRMYTLLFFLLGLFFIILGMVDFYTSPPDNLFRNLTYATIKIIVGGILWAITVFFSWAQNRRVGIFVCFLLGSCLLLIAIGEMCASPPPSPFYGPGRYIPYAISKFIMGIILWGFMLYLSWKTLKEKRIGKEKKIRAFSASRRLSTASRIFQ